MSDPVQRDLFAPTIGEAVSARDAALATVAEHAEGRAPGFAAAARACVLERLARGPATAEDLTDHCVASGVIPHDLRAMGPVLLALSRERLIVKAGACVRRRGHGTSGGNLWALSQTTGPKE